MKLSAAQKSATMIITLGEDIASKVLQFLTPKEIELISSAIISLPQLSRDQLQDILDETQSILEETAALSVNTNDYLRSILEKSIGNEKAARLLDELLAVQHEEEPSGLDMLNDIDANLAVNIIKKEHPQVIATILLHLRRELAADILELFDEELRNDVMLRIATFAGVEPSTLQVLSSSLSELLEGQNVKLSDTNGVRTAAEIINLMKEDKEDSIIGALRNYDSDLADRIIDEMFLFENLLEIDNRSIQRLLKDVDNDSLIIALKGSSVELREKFLSNMSQRAASILLDELETRPPVRMSQVEEEQRNILSIARTLSESGEIILGRGDDEYV